MEFKRTNIITPYSTYLLSKYYKEVTEIVICESCSVKFATNIGRKRCSSLCAKKARKTNKKKQQQFNQVKKMLWRKK